MTDIQRVLFKLLTEVDGICRRNDIIYYLHENTALLARRSKRFGDEDFCHVDVAMDVSNLRRFMSVVEKEKPEGRIVESWLNNERYGEFGARYVDENTLFLDLPNSHSYGCYGFGVRISVLRDIPHSSVTSKRLTAKEIGWEMSYSEGTPAKGRKAAFCGKLSAVGMKLKSGLSYTTEMFNEFCRAYDNSESNVCFTKRFRGKRHHFKKSVFGQPRSCVFENHEFYIPAEDEYFRVMYGANWKTRKLSGRRVTQWVITDTEIPYKDYLKETAEYGCSLDEYRQHRDKFNEEKKAGQPKVDIIHHYWDLLFRTGDRYDLWEIYEPIKDKVMKLHREQRFDELSNVLKPYRKLINKNYKLGLGLCFDPDILECMLDVFRYEGQEEYAQKLLNLVPPEHMKPIVIKGYDD